MTKNQEQELQSYMEELTSQYNDERLEIIQKSHERIIDKLYEDDYDRDTINDQISENNYGEGKFVGIQEVVENINNILNKEVSND